MRRLFLIALFLITCPASAQHTVLTQQTTGTGFFINKQGHVVTNEHVVRQCAAIILTFAAGDVPAQLVASDAARDLAVLKMNGESPNIAPLRWNIEALRVGDEVAVLGYPGERGARGHSTFVKSSVTGLVGPAGEAGMLQLAPVAERGNSGGPVLDSNGHVIAVITGTASFYATNARNEAVGAPLKRVDTAITLASLGSFLTQHLIPYYQLASSEDGYGDRILSSNAAKFIVPVRCIQATRRVP